MKPQATVKVSKAGLLQQRDGAGGNSGGVTDDCEKCGRNHPQRRLFIGPDNGPLEREAAAIAEQASAGPVTVNPAGASAPAPASVNRTLAGPGRPLDPGLLQDMQQRFGHDFSRVRIHTGVAAGQSARDVQSYAYTVGNDIVFGAGNYMPELNRGRRLVAHELTHVIQQSGAAADNHYVARSVDDWLTGSVDVSTMSYTLLLAEIDELTQYLNRQTTSSADTDRVDEALTALRAEVNRRDTAAAGPATRAGSRSRRGGSRQRTPAVTAGEPLPARYPRILVEQTSVSYIDPVEMREEYDLIMAWLARTDLPENERMILNAERENIAPQLRSDLQRVATERHAARVRTALEPADTGASDTLASQARTIQNIASDPEHPDIAYIYDRGERIAITTQQAEQLRSDLLRELRHAGRRIQSNNSYYWDRYNSQLAINRDSPIIAGISGWLADVEDPGQELSSRYFWSYHRIRAFENHLNGGRVIEAAAILPQVEHASQEIRQLARAFYEGHIEGAEIAAHRLEFTRDASFAIAGSIGAVVAAPVVAGYVAGAGITGTGATALTVIGTGTTVGTGVGVVRGTTAAGGELLAGGSWSQALSSFRGEFSRGFREGFVAGATGGAARLLGLAAGAGATMGEQVIIRVAGDFVVNSTATMLDTLWQSCAAGNCDIDLAVRRGIASGVASIPGSVVGLSNSQLTRNFLAPLTAGATEYVSAIHAGATPEDALRSAGVAVTSNLAMSRAAHGAEMETALHARGHAAGESTRAAVSNARSRRTSTGTADTVTGRTRVTSSATVPETPTPVTDVENPQTTTTPASAGGPESTTTHEVAAAEASVEPPEVIRTTERPSTVATVEESAAHADTTTGPERQEAAPHPPAPHPAPHAIGGDLASRVDQALELAPRSSQYRRRLLALRDQLRRAQRVLGDRRRRITAEGIDAVEQEFALIIDDIAADIEAAGNRNVADTLRGGARSTNSSDVADVIGEASGGTSGTAVDPRGHASSVVDEGMPTHTTDPSARGDARAARRALRNATGSVPSQWQRHHLVPLELREHRAVYEYERLIAQIDNPRATASIGERWINQTTNALPMPSDPAAPGASGRTIHRGSHPQYTDWMEGRLDQLWHEYTRPNGLTVQEFGRRFEALVGEAEIKLGSGQWGPQVN